MKKRFSPLSDLWKLNKKGGKMGKASQPNTENAKRRAERRENFCLRVCVVTSTRWHHLESESDSTNKSDFYYQSRELSGYNIPCESREQGAFHVKASSALAFFTNISANTGKLISSNEKGEKQLKRGGEEKFPLLRSNKPKSVCFKFLENLSFYSLQMFFYVFFVLRKINNLLRGRGGMRAKRGINSHLSWERERERKLIK